MVRTGVYSRFGLVTIVAFLLTLVFIFAFQADNIVAKPWHIALIAIPILFQVYMNTSLAYGLMRWLHLVPSSERATSLSARWRLR
jgi:ACR3 family arsenite transporter